MVRLQVVDEEWHDQTPLGPSQAEDEPLPTPYRIKGSMQTPGLGVCIWWDDPIGGDDEGAAEAMEE